VEVCLYRRSSAFIGGQFHFRQHMKMAAGELNRCAVFTFAAAYPWRLVRGSVKLDLVIGK